MRALDINKAFEEINGSPQYDSTIQSTGTSARNGTAFTKGQRVLVQPDAACYVRPGDGTITVSSSNGVYLDANEKFYMCLKADLSARSTDAGETHIAVISVSGTVNLKVFKME